MLIYALYGFVLGFIVPIMARRFAKIMPAAASEVVWRLICPLKKSGETKRKANQRYQMLKNTYFWRCFMFGLLTSCLFVVAAMHFRPFGLGGILAFIWALILLLETDYKTMLLPDVVTVPLIIGGFIFSSIYGVWVLPEESAFGAAAGYLLPVIAGLFVVWKHANAFGGGDVKLLTAVGAWTGVLAVVYVIVLSCLLFSGFAFVCKRRSGAFGPAVSIAAIIIAFYFF